MHVELEAWEQNSKLRPKAGLHEEFPQRGRAAERPIPFVEAAEGRHRYGGWLSAEFGALLPSI